MKSLKFFAFGLLLSVNALTYSKLSYEEAQGRVNGSQIRYQGLKNEIREIDSKVNSEHNKLTLMRGKPEYNQDFQSRLKKIKTLTDRRNKLVDECSESLNGLQEDLQQVGRSYYVSSGDNGEFSVQKATMQKPKPIVQKSNRFATGRLNSRKAS